MGSSSQFLPRRWIRCKCNSGTISASAKTPHRTASLRHPAKQSFICMGDDAPASNGGSDNDECSIDIPCDIWINVDEASVTERRAPRIPKVPFTTRTSENLTKAVPLWIEPSMISIGPYHFKGYYEVQKLKTMHAQKFIEESGQERDELYRKIEKKTPELKTWYDVNVNDLRDYELTAIFLVDGCFLLNFINCSSKEDGFTELGLTNSEMATIKQDLFLVENQLPYQVLQLLFEGAKPSVPSMEEKIKDFVVSHVPFPRGTWGKQVNNPSPLHLLHYMHAVLLDKPKIRSSRPQKRDKDDQRRGRGRANWRLCRTVQELMEVGIYFKPSATSCLTDISFKPDHYGTGGCLRLPTISMNTSTMITLLNLVALESSNTTYNHGVISYLCFMDSLIGSWDDVKELQAAGVLRNFVGEPKEVAQFFNTACNKVVPNPSAYKDVKLQIESHVHRHCNSKWLTRYVELKQKYFRSPWSFIALTAAIIALSLTAIQTFTALLPR